MKNILIRLDHIEKITNNLNKSDTWKFQSTIAINFIFSKNNKERVTHSKSNNKEIMINDKADEVVKELFESILNRYQIGLKTSMKNSDFSLIVFIYSIINVIK